MSGSPGGRDFDSNGRRKCRRLRMLIANGLSIIFGNVYLRDRLGTCPVPLAIITAP